jgi:FtsP/CotA-like multicopper oxidase with cupredoxin domain
VRTALAAETDWRDAVLVDREDTVEVAFVADNPGRWMLHCHILEHQAGGMATWFDAAT